MPRGWARQDPLLTECYCGVGWELGGLALHHVRLVGRLGPFVKGFLRRISEVEVVGGGILYKWVWIGVEDTWFGFDKY